MPLRKPRPRRALRHAAQALLLKIERMNRRTIAQRGELDTPAIAALLAATVAANPSPELYLGLADFIGTALEGSTIDLSAWTLPKPPPSRRKL